MMTKTLIPSLFLLAVASVQETNAFSAELSRRDAVVKTLNTVAGGVAATVAVPNLANAVPEDETARVTTRMGGLLVCFQVRCFIF